ncbi:MAG: sugar ABC transporter permease [Faecalibacterium sp.]
MKKPKMKLSDNAVGYIAISPWLIGLFVFTFIPMSASLVLAFTDYNGMSTPSFVGFQNFQRMLTDDSFWAALKATFSYVFLLVPARLAFALAVAMILNSKRKGLGFYRAAYYLPSLLGGSIAVAIMWKQIFGSDGLINALLAIVGIESTTSWIGNTKTAMAVIVLLGVWQFGASMLIFIAGLKQIPVSYYEAATIDGASPLRKFTSITLPMLTPTIFFNLIMQTINAFKAFNESYIITGGGPLDKTLFYSLYTYQQSFVYFKMGYGSALAWVLLMIIGLFSLLIFRSSESWVYYENKGGK